MKLYVFDDSVADGWHPFALTRPCSELLFGTMRLRQRIERFAGRPATGAISRAWLGEFVERDTPPVITDPSSVADGTARLFISSRAVPDPTVRFSGGDGPMVLEIDGEVVGCHVPEGQAAPPPDWFERPGPVSGWSSQAVAGRTLGRVWELIAGSPAQTTADIEAMRPEEPVAPEGVELRGSGRLVLGRDVSIEPNVLFDTSDGPIMIGDRTEIFAGSRIAGPFVCGADCRLLGGSLSGVTAGSYSYLRGEVEESIVLGYANKAHDGFLGHAYVGSWVNLGAMTTNSDLKNNYGTVRLTLPEGEVDTGLTKLGCLIGDHARTGIGTLINTGSVIGAGSNLFGGAMPPRWVPPFSWGSGDALTEYRLDAFLGTARIVMGRRGQQFDEGVERWLSAVWEAGRESVE